MTKGMVCRTLGVKAVEAEAQKEERAEAEGTQGLVARDALAESADESKPSKAVDV